MSPDRQLEDLLAVLVERFGRSKTLGEVYATVHALRVLRSGGTLTLSEVAEATGSSKQNLSRWLKYQIEIGQVTTREAEDDGRMRNFDITDPDWAYRHLESVAEVLGCEVHPPLPPSDD
jgi:DNA-binding transcriptional regulator GbsR (MarR family)